jgi:hypothetical protein
VAAAVASSSATPSAVATVQKTNKASASLRRKVALVEVLHTAAGPVSPLPAVTPLSAAQDKVIRWLSALARDFLVPPSAVPLHEAATYSSTSVLRRMFAASPRAALITALSTPHVYVPCDCCPRDAGCMSASMNDTVVAFRVLQRMTRVVSIPEWYAGFAEVFAGVDDDDGLAPRAPARAPRARHDAGRAGGNGRATAKPAASAKGRRGESRNAGADDDGDAHDNGEDGRRGDDDDGFNKSRRGKRQRKSFGTRPSALGGAGNAKRVRYVDGGDDEEDAVEVPSDDENLHELLEGDAARRRGGAVSRTLAAATRYDDDDDDDEDVDVTGAKGDSGGREQLVRACFVRAVQELRTMGFVRPYRRRPDCVEKCVFDVSAW